jgi:murein lipoprotein
LGECRYKVDYSSLIYNNIAGFVWYRFDRKVKELIMLRNNGKIVLMLSVLAGLAGCATTSEMDSLRAEIKQANETAQQASQTANSAAAKADAASKQAAAASQTADEAKASAEEANSKIDRMFKKSMYK